MRILAVDIGTSTVKSAVVDFEEGLRGFTSNEVPLQRPVPEAAEHEPNILVEILKGTIKETTRKGDTGEVDGVVFSGYLFGLIALDGQNKPLTNIFTWLDRRPTNYLSRLYQVLDPLDVYRRTGCPPLYIYQLAKLFWLKHDKETIISKTKTILDAKGYVLLQLVGEKVMDKSSASGSQLLNTHLLDWDYDLLQEIGIESDILPGLVEPDTVVGELPVSTAKELGLKSQVPVIAGVFDGAAVSVGLGGLGQEIATSHLSTSTMLRVASTEPIIDKSPQMRFQTYYCLKRMWLPGGAVNSGGIVLRWFRDNLGSLEKMLAQDLGISAYELLDREASLSPPGASGIIFLPYISGERFPTFGNNSSGVIFGLREWHTKRDILRAFMEGVAYNLNLVNEALRENNLNFREVRITGGGARSQLWLQILADVLNVPVKAFTRGDAALLGSALVARSTLDPGFNLAEFERSLVFDSIAIPSQSRYAYEGQYEKFKKVLSCLAPLFSEN
jgi:gluconokinase